MKTGALNFHHLYYFWVVAKEGSVTRAARRLGVAVQTISVQLGLLEKSVGKSLLAPQGRRLVPTDAGRRALTYADQIFLLGEQMQHALLENEANQAMHLTVGISDSLPKLTAHRLLAAALDLPQKIRLICYEDRFEQLLGDLALHKLDLVLTDRPVHAASSLRVFSHLLGESPVMLFAAAELAGIYRQGFPDALHGAPLLLPTKNHAVRSRIDQWFESRHLSPDVVGEFEDNALMNTFGRSGRGLFPAPAALAADVAAHYGAEPVGELSQVSEQVFAISNERKIKHPAIEAIFHATQARMPASEAIAPKTLA